MTAQQTIPDGYRQDGQGRLVHESMIKPIDQERDRLVRDLVKSAIHLNGLMAGFKAQAFGDVRAFIEMSFEEYGARVGGKKGNVTLLTFDGRYKLQIAVQDSISFDERLQAARSLIDECLAEWTEGARPEVVTLVNDAFRTDTKGEIRTASVLALRRLEIADKRWQRAMKAIGEACQVTSSKEYLRIYERIGSGDHYQPISLDIASIAAPNADEPRVGEVQ
ncbi:DUF3164 family protein [Stutzerimonas kirkiae]|uniref:DUF3164 family protein n=1 Tax=Stutzerimonas kirkiae TaxID=2211392 RepID=UPI001038572C|nr:DUF3164 family protein [Stutzerimonas kirkiae]TBV12780.1 sulfate transporter [Stutzerimonas kirkiae]